MRINRKPDEWLALLDQQQRSGLSKNQFCRQHGITRSAFSNATKRLSARPAPATAFLPALPPQSRADNSIPSAPLDSKAPALSEPVTPETQAARQLALRLPGATLSLPVDISPRWLATLLREMVP